MYLIFAILALSFLIFIHELGHYLMAKRVGMRVETFSIGFGRPIFSWKRNGEEWKIGWLPFGGYVKIAGAETEKGEDLFAIKDGFFGKTPWERIKVAFMGPLVNLLFAVLAFAVLFALGGRQKNFADFTVKIGLVDPKSELYAAGVRPGDEIISYDGQLYQGAKDHLYAPMTSGSSHMEIKGFKVDPKTGEKKAFDAKIKPYQHPQAAEKGVLTAGILAPASYVIYDKLADGSSNPLPEGSPLANSGIQYGDRIIAVDGERIFSLAELNQVLNDGRALLTVKRGDETKLVRVPRVLVQELRLDKNVREELIDWQYEAGLNRTKIQNLYMIPFDLSDDGVVQAYVKFIDKEGEEEAFPKQPFSELTVSLLPGDRIIAVDGFSVSHAPEILQKLQKNQVNIIVERPENPYKKIFWKEASALFDNEVNRKDLNNLIASIGTKTPLQSIGNLYLLKPVLPKMRKELQASLENQTLIAAQVEEQKKIVSAIEDPEKRAEALRLLNNHEKQLLIGLPNVQDLKVNYNPGPLELFTTVFDEIWRTLKALFTGSLNPKWISGPVGIVQVVHDNWMLGFKEALFWLGAISLNLGALNLLPIPMLDGGMILISFVELVTGRRMHPKTLEKLTLPFAILLIGFFIFLTYNDLSRVFTSFMR